MAAPATTALANPAGIMMDDGYSTRIAFARDTTVGLWIKTITPPGLDGGDAIDNTTMHNTTYRTFVARSLATLTETSFVAGYDPLAFKDILDNLLNQNADITVHFPDGSTLDFYGYIRVFEPQEMAEGDHPVANVTIQPTNYDPVNAVEESAVLTEVAGT